MSFLSNVADICKNKCIFLSEKVLLDLKYFNGPIPLTGASKEVLKCV